VKRGGSAWPCRMQKSARQPCRPMHDRPFKKSAYCGGPHLLHNTQPIPGLDQAKNRSRLDRQPLRILAAALQRVELELAPHPVIGCLSPTDGVMISRSIAFLFAAVALAGCCVSGNGCYAPLPGTPTAWDGLDPAPAETAAQATEYRPRKLRARRTKLSSDRSVTFRWSHLSLKKRGRSKRLQTGLTRRS
jgi:hypothetical protein